MNRAVLIQRGESDAFFTGKICPSLAALERSRHARRDDYESHTEPSRSQRTKPLAVVWSLDDTRPIGWTADPQELTVDACRLQRVGESRGEIDVLLRARFEH